MGVEQIQMKTVWKRRNIAIRASSSAPKVVIRRSINRVFDEQNPVALFLSTAIIMEYLWRSHNASDYYWTLDNNNFANWDPRRPISAFDGRSRYYRMPYLQQSLVYYHISHLWTTSTLHLNKSLDKRDGKWSP